MESTIVHLSSWGRTVRGNDISLTYSLHKESPILFIGGVHGDEPEGVALAEDFLLWLHKNNKRVVHSWALIPCLNIDGYYQRERTNQNGVDLNRNFPTDDWVSSFKAPRYFPGKKAGSEPEVQKIVGLIDELKPKLIVHFHSWKPCVVYTGEKGSMAAQILGTDTGYEVRPDIGYPTPGSLGQYGWFKKNTPVICIEAQEGEQLDSIWPHFKTGLIKLMTENFKI